MSLVSHYRFDGDLLDYGSNNHAIHNLTPSYTTGKIGKCLDLRNEGIIEAQLKKPVRWENISVSYWCKSTGNTPDNYRQIFNLSNDNVTVLYGDNRVPDDTYILHGFKDSYESKYNAIALIGVSEFAKQEWNHYTTTIKDGKYVKGYRNGVLVSEIEIDLDTSLYYNITKIIFNGGNRNEILLDDFMLFDHTLSKKEIKELSKGLLLHYKLDSDDITDSSPQQHKPSLVQGTFYEPSENTPGSVKFESGKIDTGTDLAELTGDTSYTISAWIKLNQINETTMCTSPLSMCIVGTDGSKGIGMQVVGDKINFGCRSTSNFMSNQVINIGEWYHICCIRDTSFNPPRAKIFINGELDYYNDNGKLSVLQPDGNIVIG